MHNISPLPHIQVVAGIIWRNNSFLAALRPKNKSFAGYWEFPGGKIEQGESLEQALTRELKEELDIQVLTAQKWFTKNHTYEDITVTLHFLHVTAFLGKPHANEGQMLRWVSVAEAQNMPFLPADLPIIKKLTPPTILS